MEGGSLKKVLLAGIVYFSVIGGLAGLYALFLAATHDNRIKRSDDTPTRCRKLKRNGRKIIMGLVALSHLMLAVVQVYMLYKIGTMARTSDAFTINWSYFALGEALSFLPLAGALSVFFWFEGNMGRLLLAGIWAVAMVALGVAPLTATDSKRNVIFASSVIAQALGYVTIFFAGFGLMGRLFRFRGALVALAMAAAFVLYDTFWAIGYENAPHKSTNEDVDARWQSHLAFLFAAISAHTIAGLLAYRFYSPRKDSVEAMGPEAGPINSEMEEGAASRVAVDSASGVELVPSAGLQGF